jgi:hypothetical protein
MSAGYSGTPLAKKIGIKAGHSVAILHEAPEFRGLLADLPDDVDLDAGLTDQPDVTVAFYTEAEVLDAELGRLADAAFPDRMIWIAWPKRTSGVETDLTGDVVRRTVLATDLVDVKVCAISETWSGLKVVWRTSAR